MNEQETVFNYWQMLWREASPDSRRRGRIALAIYLGLFLLGSYLAAQNVAAVAAMDGLGRLVGAVLVGPMGVVWTILKLTGFIIENADDPGLGWLIPVLFHAGPWVAVYALGQLPLNPAMVQKRMAEKHQRNQGQLKSEEAAAKLPLKVGVPLTVVQNKEKKPVKVGVDFFTGQGHILVTAPTRAGKGLQLTDVLTHWPGAAVVVDPKSEQYRRTAGFRKNQIGPVYHLPGHHVHLAHYYNFRDRDDIQELHDQLLRPDEDMQRIFADKSLPLFQAVGRFASVKGLNPLRVLLDAAEDDFQRVLTGLDSVPSSRPHVRQFTNGQPPDKVTTADRFVSSAYGTFSTRLFGYQKHIDTICPHTPKNTLPREWAEQKATLYITYSLNELDGVGGVVAAILAGLMRDHMANGRKRRLLIAIDEMAAVRLRNLDTYLATVGGYGITMLLYAQSTSQIKGIYGRAGAEAILSNCAHQVWYPPNDIQTAKRISDLYGTTLKPNRSFSTVNRTMRQENGQMRTIPQQSMSESLLENPTYSPTEVMALGKNQVFVFTEKEQQYRFIGQRLDSRETFQQLPPSPWPPVFLPEARRYTEWLSEPEAVTPASAADDAPVADVTTMSPQEAEAQKDETAAAAPTPTDDTSQTKVEDVNERETAATPKSAAPELLTEEAASEKEVTNGKTDRADTALPIDSEEEAKPSPNPKRKKLR